MIRADMRKALFLLLVLCVAVSHQKGKKKRKPTTTTEPTTTTTVNPLYAFDLLVFVQSWPQTSCYNWKKKDPSNLCQLPTDKEWLIHGIWPARYGRQAPTNCPTDASFHIKDLATVEQDLNTKWTTIRNGFKNKNFWLYEWNKHGSCAATLTPLNTVLKYFQQGLKFFGLHDMKHRLAEQGIRPGNTYTKKNIIDALKAAVGKNVAFNCIHNFVKKESYLHEVRICFDKQLNVIDCDGMPGYQTTCWEKVVYPDTVPT